MILDLLVSTCGAIALAVSDEFALKARATRSGSIGAARRRLILCLVVLLLLLEVLALESIHEFR